MKSAFTGRATVCRKHIWKTGCITEELTEDVNGPTGNGSQEQACAAGLGEVEEAMPRAERVKKSIKKSRIPGTEWERRSCDSRGEALFKLEILG